MHFSDKTSSVREETTLSKLKSVTQLILNKKDRKYKRVCLKVWTYEVYLCDSLY